MKNFKEFELYNNDKKKSINTKDKKDKEKKKNKKVKKAKKVKF